MSSAEFNAKLPCGDELRIRYALGTPGGDLHCEISVRAMSGALRFGAWQHIRCTPDSTARLKVKVTPETLQVGDAEIGGLTPGVAVTVAAFFAELPGFYLTDETRTPYRRMWTPAWRPESAA